MLTNFFCLKYFSNFGLVEGISKIQTMIGSGATNSELYEEIKKLAISLSLSNEYRYYILICGLFSKERNIVKFWTKNEQVFIDLVSADGKIGIRHLMQSIVQFFVRKNPQMSVYSGTFMKLLYDQEVFEEEFILRWYNKKLKLDKTCALYDKRAER